MALVVGAGLLFGAVKFDDMRSDREQVLENTRFVRETSMNPDALRPFTEIHLEGANLSGLPLGCSPDKKSSDSRPCTVLTGANLSNAKLNLTSLTGAMLVAADLSGVEAIQGQFDDADLRSSDLRGARLWMASLTGAILVDADLAGADLRAADLSGVDLSDGAPRNLDRVCYGDDPNEDGFTIWPEGFTPPGPPVGCQVAPEGGFVPFEL